MVVFVREIRVLEKPDVNFGMAHHSACLFGSVDSS